MGDLLVAPALGLADRPFHGTGDAVRIEDRPAIEVTRRPTDGLDQRALGAQETFLVRIEDRHQRHLGHVQALAQQVDPHQHIEGAQAQVADDFHPLHGVDVRVQVTHPHAVVGEVVGEVFGHALGQGGDQHALFHGHAFGYFREQVVDLGQRRADLHLRVHQTGGTNHLLDDPAGMLGFVVAGGGGDKNGLRAHRFPFVEAHRPVVQRRGQAETVLHQGFLARTVALVHGADLRNADVGLVDHQQRVGRQVVVEGRRRLPGSASREVARVVFDTVAVTQFEDHFQVEAGALLQALGFHQLVVVAQVAQAFLELLLDPVDGAEQGFPRCHVVAFRIEGKARQLADHFAGQWVEGREAFHFVVEQLDADRFQVGFGRVHIDHVAAHTERRPGEIHVVAGVLQVGQAAQQGALVEFVATVHVQDHLQVGFRAAQAIDAGHRGDDDGVLALQQRLGRRQAHLFDMVVDRRILLDKGIGGGHVGFRLVVVVVGNEILHGVVREKRLELAVQLRGQGLVRRQHQGRALHLGDHVGDAEGLARAGHPEQGLVSQAGFDALDHLTDGFGLVAGGLEAGDELEFGHNLPLGSFPPDSRGENEKDLLRPMS